MLEKRVTLGGPESQSLAELGIKSPRLGENFTIGLRDS
jgi:hypothetical protein